MPPRPADNYCLNPLTHLVTDGPTHDLEELMTRAKKGLPVGGTQATWEPERPATVKQGTANKPRGFLTYNRRPAPYRPEEERLQDWDEVQRHDSARVDGESADRLHTQVCLRGAGLAPRLPLQRNTTRVLCTLLHLGLQMPPCWTTAGQCSTHLRHAIYLAPFTPH